MNTTELSDAALIRTLLVVRVRLTDPATTGRAAEGWVARYAELTAEAHRRGLRTAGAR